MEKQSAKIASLMAETEQRLAALKEEDSAIEKQWTALAAAPRLDTETLLTLQARRQALSAELDILGRRVRFLKNALVEAEHGEAEERVTKIQAETQALAQQGEELMERFRTSLGAMLQTVEESRELARSRSVLASEGEFLRVKHGLPWPAVAQVPVPKVDDLRELTIAVEKLLRADLIATDWSRAADKLKQESERAARTPHSASPRVDDNSPSPAELFQRAIEERSAGYSTSAPVDEKKRPGWSVTNPGGA